MDINAVIKPFFDIFSRSQIQSVFLAWLPTKLNPYLTGILTVDAFVITLFSSAITTFFCMIFAFINYLVNDNAWNKKNILTLQIEYYAVGSYCDYHKSIIYESLSWLISNQIKTFESGSFILKPAPNKNKIKDIVNILPDSTIIPENNNKILIEFKGNKFNIHYKIPENENKKNQDDQNNYYHYNPMILHERQPSIYLSTSKYSNTKLSNVIELLNEISINYLENQKKKKGRFRYENKHSSWFQIQKLASCRGLDSITLDEQQEILLKKELETFVNDKKFYEKVGMPYRRGILLYGKPGTGKTSLINAISAHLCRDIYYLNLKLINDDSELSALFSTVPPNQLIVIEDVDTQSNVLHRRKSNMDNNDFIENNSSKETNKERKKYFSLSTFLTCLDGHIISEGNIIIMTTNHLELLDPACVRSGRMDVHLELGYCTHYQLNKLFKITINGTGLPTHMLKTIPEKLLPPCEVMTLMSLYNKDKEYVILNKLNELVNKYRTKNENSLDKLLN